MRSRKKTPKQPVEIAAYSISAFCRAHSISEPHYYRLQQRGQGPRTMKAGTRTLITVEAAADWRRDREHDAAGNATAA